MFPDFDRIIFGWLGLTVVLAIVALFGIWKLAEIAWWLWCNVSVTVGGS